MRVAMSTYNKGVAVFDLSLTPENAAARGYKYIDDVIYNVFALNGAIIDILKLVKEKGYKLGTPSRQNEFEAFYGLYAPITHP